MNFPNLVKVNSLGQYKISISYEDGTEGIIDLSYLKDKPVFQKWASNDFFNQVHINDFSKSVMWDDEIELCPDNLYLKLKNLTFKEFEKQTSSLNYAANQ